MKGAKLKSAFVVSAIAIALGVTNPNQEAYLNYATEKLIKQAEKALCEQIGYCELGNPPILIKNTLIKPAIATATKRQNLILFSLYTTEFTNIKTLKTLGILGIFWTYSE